MDDNRIEEIVLKVFETAKKEHPSHSRFALSKHVSDHSDLSSKTLERAYDRYINRKRKHGIPQAESVELFCKYLGFESYSDFVKRNPIGVPDDRKVKKNEKSGNGEGWKRLIVPISIGFGLIIMIVGVQNWHVFSQNNLEDKECMTWADSLYVAISCDTSPLSKFGTIVEPIDRIKLKNFKRAEITAGYDFFTVDDKPLVWYYKNKDDEIEYFTSPGLHPTTGETLRKITPYIIQAYVPMHSNKNESFVPE